MTPQSLIEYNLHLRNAQEYQRASVLYSIAVESVKRTAEHALNNSTGKAVKHD